MNINIDIDDERYFIDVAPVVDRDDFKREVERIRSNPKLKSIIQTIKSGRSRFLSKSENELIDFEIDKSRKQLFLPVVFRNVIAAVVFSNKVTNDDYSPAYLDCKWDHESFNKEGTTPDETYFIVLSPGARDTDVLKAYQKYRDQLGNIKGAPEYKYIHKIWEINKKKPSIKKYRKWYL